MQRLKKISDNHSIVKSEDLKYIDNKKLDSKKLDDKNLDNKKLELKITNNKLLNIENQKIKIFYSVCGEGMGHAVRSGVILEELTKKRKQRKI